LKERCYALLKTQTDVWALYETCKSAGLVAKIAPTPRVADAHASCGTSLLIDCESVNAVQALAGKSNVSLDGIVRVADSIDPTRDRFC
jgi:hypothetical protein